MTQDVSITPHGTDPAWSTANTLTDLGRLTADWLQGDLNGRHPNGPHESADEILPHLATLAAANRAGIVTLTGSIRPGSVTTTDGERREQLASIVCLIARDNDGLLHQLAAQAWRSGIQVFVHHPASPADSWPIAVSTHNGEPLAYAGNRIGTDERQALWEEGCRQGAVASAVEAVQVTLIDPVIGRTSALWRVLEAASSHPAPDGQEQPA